MKVHFIAIGGSAMHNLALALHHKGYEISGSDDEIFEPSRSRLAKVGLLPPEEGWHPERIHKGLDAVILGMHAKGDNLELLRARELGLKIFSYPEFLYEQAKDKKRVVIAGSHGKTTITAMVMHVLQDAGIPFDFMVGAQLEGFDVMVKMTNEAEVMIFEGDEYLTSAIDLRPKFHLYKPHIALVTGIAWDHINVFPTFEIYLDQFRKFISMIVTGGTLIYYCKDKNLESLKSSNSDISTVPYDAVKTSRINGKLYMGLDDKQYPVYVFGDHNMQNIAGALEICRILGISNEDFGRSISSFKGASKRLQLIAGNDYTAVYLDFAHAPSKLKATVDAVQGHFAGRRLVACMELHTYSSLNEEFLEQYHGSMDSADLAYVYYNPHTLKLKRLPDITPEQVRKAFGRPDLKVYSDSSAMLQAILAQDWKDSILLLMSSGNFDGLDAKEIAKKILK